MLSKRRSGLCMSTNPLHYKNNIKEVIEILSCSVIPGVSANLTFSFGSFEKSEDERKFVSALFPAPVRVDMFDDEGSNISFESETGFERVSNTVPGVIQSKKSKYLEDFLKSESFVEAHSGEQLTHYVVWSYGGGVVHILSANRPTLEEI